MGEVSGKRRVDCSASSGPSFYARGGQEKKERWGEESEAYVIYSGECHVRGPNH